MWWFAHLNWKSVDENDCGLKRITLVFSGFTDNFYFGHQSVNLFINISCRLCSSGVISAMSSANSKILIVSSLNFTPQQSSFMFSAKSFIYTENNVGLSIQPCFTPDDIWNQGVSSWFTRTAHLTSSYSDLIAVKTVHVFQLFVVCTIGSPVSQCRKPFSRVISCTV